MARAGRPRQGGDGASPIVRLDAGFEAEWPGASRLATECVLNLGMLGEQLAAFGEALARRHGVPSRAAFNVLAILAGADGPLPPSTIAERMVVSRPALTGVLGTLERRGMVRRLPHPTDGRMALLEPTARGLDAVAGLRPALHRAERAWLDCLSEVEQRALLRTSAAAGQHATSLRAASISASPPPGRRASAVRASCGRPRFATRRRERCLRPAPAPAPARRRSGRTRSAGGGSCCLPPTPAARRRRSR